MDTVRNVVKWAKEILFMECRHCLVEFQGGRLSKSMEV